MTLDLKRPMFSWPHRLTATNHLRVTYTDASTQNVSLSSGLYYPDGHTSGLLAQLQSQLNSDATAGGTWVVAYDNSYRISITRSGGTKTPASLTFLTDQLTAADLGFDASPFSSTGSGGFVAPWRPARMWTPDEPMTVRRANLDPVVSWAQSRYTGRVLAEKRAALGGVLERIYVIPAVSGALCYDFAAQIQAFCDVVDADLGYVSAAAGDPNMALDRWMDRYLAGADEGTLPRARVAKDRATPGTYDDVTLFTGQQVPDVIADMATEPLLGTVTIRATPYTG